MKGYDGPDHKTLLSPCKTAPCANLLGLQGFRDYDHPGEGGENIRCSAV